MRLSLRQKPNRLRGSAAGPGGVAVFIEGRLAGFIQVNKEGYRAIRHWRSLGEFNSYAYAAEAIAREVVRYG